MNRWGCADKKVVPLSQVSEFRVKKERAHVALTLSSGVSSQGSFFVAGASARHLGPESVGDLLNADAGGFLPFEADDADGPLTVLLNRAHIVMVTLADNEAAREPAYNVATRRTVLLTLSNGVRVAGCVSVYRPAGRDRLSDWAQNGDRFRYVELPEATVIVNLDHIVEARELES